MSKFNKYILPLALVKIILAFLVLQLFFSSCEKEDILYDSGLFSEGPVFEIEAQLGNEKILFATDAQDNGINLGDTLYLVITLESNKHFDQISQSEVALSNPEYHSQFVFVDEEGKAVFPDYFVESGRMDDVSDEFFITSFGKESPVDVLMSPVGGSIVRLKVGFIFSKVGSYTFHFQNTPNKYISDGSVDIYYNRNVENPKDVKKAYAVYLFDLDLGKTQNYNLDGDTRKTEILHCAEFDQAIVDFAVIPNN